MLEEKYEISNYIQLCDIIEGIKKLPKDELKMLLDWMEDFEQRLWDEEFERDVKMGKMEKLAKQAIKDFKAGKCRQL